ncbi:MAG: tyrosine-type recombinase/integrase, partial [Candidatus Korarchaeota archaeon]|nr:tyrosine-type recombinase/integrase [Candidatus Korarchaeota archaeon]
MKFDLHRYRARLLRALQSLERGDISPTNAKLIRAFHDDCFVEGLSVPRVEKYVRHLTTLARWLRKDFDKATTDDLKQVLYRIQRSHYSEWTKRDLRVSLKKFYRWMRRSGRCALDVGWIKTGRVNQHRILPTDLLTPDDISKMVSATTSPRNKALIILLYETGARVGELARLRISDLSPHPHGMQVHFPVEGKTGSRRVLVVASVPYLKAWLNAHPNPDNPAAPLWQAYANSPPPRYGAICQILRRAAQAAGVRKRVNPHNFRHSRATYLANYLTEAQMNQYFGWVQGSDMPSTYVHLSGRDVDAAILRTYGIKLQDDDPPDKLAPRRCTQCETEN